MKSIKTITETAKEIPVFEDVEVLVVGGGAAGVGAAVGAARQGARTLLVESAGALGGMWTVAMQTHATCFHDGKKVIVGGLAREIIGRLQHLGAAEDPVEKVKVATPSYYVAFDLEMMKCVLDEVVLNSGAQLLLHANCVGTLTEGGRVTGVIIESKSGRQAIQAQVVVDCTGDADVAYWAGAPTLKGRAGDGKCQPVTLTFLLADVNTGRSFEYVTEHPDHLRQADAAARRRGELTIPQAMRLGMLTLCPGVTYHNQTRILDVDSTSAADLTRAEIIGRRQVLEAVGFYQRYIPGYEKCRLLTMGATIGLRESRRIVGEYTLAAKDVLAARKFPDGIARQNYYLDVHNPDGHGCEGHTRRPPIGHYYEVPFRCLVPQKVDQLLVAGRCLSADRQAQGAARVTVCCLQMGEAAGVAAALAVKQKKTVRSLSGREIRRRLEKTRARFWRG